MLPSNAVKDYGGTLFQKTADNQNRKIKIILWGKLDFLFDILWDETLFKYSDYFKREFCQCVRISLTQNSISFLWRNLKYKKSEHSSHYYA